MPDDKKTVLFSGRQAKSEQGIGDALGSKFADVIALDPREALKTMVLSGKSKQLLEDILVNLGYTLEESKSRDRFAPVERFYTALRGEDEIAALLQIPKWILTKGNAVGAVLEIGSAFCERRVRVLSQDVDAPHPSFALLSEQWAATYNTEPLFVPWSHLALLEAGEVTMADLFKLPLKKRQAPPGAADAGKRERQGQKKKPQVFISYSHDDRKWLNRLNKQLKPLLRRDSFKVWVDKDIEPGDEWRKKIEEALGAAKVAVLLVSENFLASDFIAEVELPKLLSSAEKRGLRIIWILIDPCHWETLQVKEIQAAYHDENGKLVPLAGLSEFDLKRALKHITSQIEKAARADD